MYTTMNRGENPSWLPRVVGTAVATGAGAGLYIAGFFVADKVHHCANSTAPNESDWESRTVTVLGDPFLGATIILTSLFTLAMAVQCCMHRRPKDEFERGTRW